MPYIPKQKDLDSADGTIRLSGRDSFDADALVESSTSATGGAPTVKGNDGGMEIKPLPGAPAPRFADFGAVLPRVMRNAAFDPTRIRPDDVGMIDEMARMAEGWSQRGGQAAEAVAAAGGPRELAMRMAAVFQQNIERVQGEDSLPDRLYASREGRRIYNALERMRRERMGE